MQTQFASAERLVDEEIYKQAELIINENMIPSLFNIMPYILLIINKQRQIIYSNQSFLKLLNFPEQKRILGLRFGEILKCKHADKLPGGCGTTESCSVCGALLAILECQKKKIAITKECLLETKSKNEIVHHELEVYASPAYISNSEHILFTVRDISTEKRKSAMEKIFFHDLLNTSGAAKGLLDVIVNNGYRKDTMELAECASETLDILVDEVKNYQDIFAAESGKLEIKSTLFSVKDVIEGLVKQYLKNEDINCPINFNCTEEL
ncbi:histidine kinase [Desulfonispora thiosulfatigenes DSM 11270]|uniref:Histidine kinase n=1 Tax=Desulfonispora thiosulfatigenes DSM 11270 TaxID=656914 RepID=A0A1W1V172_DESTI|nr:PAS domain-containing protein [Desulfonispora thiosulfatigenes]SMB87066.1 histidine kinase [Desulfonispora thiosulfatigenes DSM 11270]